MKNLPTPYQDFIHKSRYARWIEDANRRESWDETVTRYLDYMCNHLQKNHGIDSIGSLYDQLYNSIIDLKGQVDNNKKDKEKTNLIKGLLDKISKINLSPND